MVSKIPAVQLVCCTLTQTEGLNGRMILVPQPKLLRGPNVLDLKNTTEDFVSLKLIDCVISINRLNDHLH